MKAKTDDSTYNIDTNCQMIIPHSYLPKTGGEGKTVLLRETYVMTAALKVQGRERFT